MKAANDNATYITISSHYDMERGRTMCMVEQSDKPDTLVGNDQQHIAVQGDFCPLSPREIGLAVAEFVSWKIADKRDHDTHGDSDGDDGA